MAVLVTGAKGMLGQDLCPIFEDAGAFVIETDVDTLDITNANEEEKEKLRGAIKYFNGERNNINVQIKVGEEYKPCGQIYLTDEILNIFKDILPNEGVKISEN